MMSTVGVKRQQADAVIDTVCCTCQKVAWNGPDGAGERRWVDARYYQSLFGALSDLVSHGICPDCLEAYWEQTFRETGWRPTPKLDAA